MSCEKVQKNTFARLFLILHDILAPETLRFQSCRGDVKNDKNAHDRSVGSDGKPACFDTILPVLKQTYIEIICKTYV